jgi:hypothetical protein
MLCENRDGMLREEKRPKIRGDYDRRWMSDDYFDLIVWYEPGGRGVHGFQLCYGKPDAEHAVTWRRTSGFTHQRVETGELGGFGA